MYFDLKVKWFKNNNEISESDRVKMSETSEDCYCLSMPAALSTDEGQYHVHASNSNGEVIAAFSLVVSFDPASATLDLNQILAKN